MHLLGGSFKLRTSVTRSVCGIDRAGYKWIRAKIGQFCHSIDGGCFSSETGRFPKTRRRFFVRFCHRRGLRNDPLDHEPSCSAFILRGPSEASFTALGSNGTFAVYRRPRSSRVILSRPKVAQAVFTLFARKSRQLRITDSAGALHLTHHLRRSYRRSTTPPAPRAGRKPCRHTKDLTRRSIGTGCTP